MSRQYCPDRRRSIQFAAQSLEEFGVLCDGGRHCTSIEHVFDFSKCVSSVLRAAPWWIADGSCGVATHDPDIAANLWKSQHNGTDGAQW